MARALPLSLLGVLLAVFLAPAAAYGIALDPTFGSQGKTTTAFGSESAGAGDVALAPDGKLVVAGQVGENRFAVARYLPTGALDTTFDGDGRATIAFAGFNAQGTAVAVQPDLRVVVAGVAQVPSGEGAQIAVARLTSGGAPDTTFSGDGRVLTPIGAHALAFDVLLQPDGKVVVGGTGTVVTGDFSDEVMAVARYTTGGVLDGSFDGDGIALADFPGPTASASALALRSGGRIVAAGGASDDKQRFAIAGFTATGAPDPVLGTEGRVVHAVADHTSNARGVVPVGESLVVAGNARDSAGRWGFGLLRIDAEGEPEQTFSGDGKAFLTFGTTDHAYAEDIIAAPGGAFVVAGSVSPPNESGPSSFALARVRADGTLDPTFDGDGRLTTAFAGPSGANAIVRQADDKLVAAGAMYDPSASATAFALARYDEGGAEVRGGVLTVKRGPTANQVAIKPGTGGGLSVRDATAALPPGPGCTRVDPNEVTCTGAVAIRVELGSGNDGVMIDPAVTTRATLDGGSGNDTLRGGSGYDTLDGGTGADDLIGGTGRDTVTYATRTTGVVIDVNGVSDDGSTSDAAGSRRDAVGTDVEAFVGGAGADTLRGDGSPETFDGGPGADTFTGRGGTDVVTYAGRLAGVTVDIGAGGADDGSSLDQTGSRRDDVQTGIEALIGGRDADTLIGDAAANRFTTSGDGLRDVVLCGAATDTVAADALDLLPSGDCETVSRG